MESVKTHSIQSILPDNVIQGFTLKNSNGIEVHLINFGAAVIRILTPDKFGLRSNIVLSYEDLSHYTSNDHYLGATIGRFANRIAKATFTLENKKFFLDENHSPNHLHGGSHGFHKVLWNVLDYGLIDGNAFVKMHYLSVDGEMGYPGDLNVYLTYTLNEDNSFVIEYLAITNKATIVNLSHHSYFNLSGSHDNDILDHELSLNAEAFLPVNVDLIPIGSIEAVHNTVFDFKEARAIGSRMFEPNLQLKYGNGYDHCWVLKGEGFRTVSTVFHPSSGRKMEVLTDQPGMQFYTGNFLDSVSPSHPNNPFKKHAGFCLETQNFPDAPNQSHFPSSVLQPYEEYRSKTAFKFSVIENF